jgi:hypothetical protein
MATTAVDVPRARTTRRPPHRSVPTQASSRGPNWGRLVSQGRAARAAADGGRWRIGNLASFVAKQYGARSLQAFSDDVGESYSTVRRYRWVYTRYEPTVRFRFQQLSFSHFQAVAGLPDRERWLARAENGCWSVDELVRQSRGAAPPPASRPDALRVPLLRASEHFARLASLDDRQIAKASSWLAPMLDELSAEIGQLRRRLRR